MQVGKGSLTVLTQSGDSIVRKITPGSHRRIQSVLRSIPRGSNNNSQKLLSLLTRLVGFEVAPPRGTKLKLVGDGFAFLDGGKDSVFRYNV